MHTRQLRNGVKFYQDVVMLESYSKNPVCPQPEPDVTVMTKITKNEATKAKKVATLKIMKPTKAIVKAAIKPVKNLKRTCQK